MNIRKLLKQKSSVTEQPEAAGKQFLHQLKKELTAKIDRIQGRLNRQELARQSVSKGEQMLLSHRYAELAERGIVLPFDEVGFQNFSQFNEDGILHYIFSLIGFEPRSAVELCAGVGYESMSANLILNYGWRALLVDGDEENVKKGVSFFSQHPSTKFIGPVFQCNWVDRESVNGMLTEAGFSGDIGLLTLDLDGVDYWIWEAITAISPRVIVVEYNNVFPGQVVTVPYDPQFEVSWIPLFGDRAQEKNVRGQIGLVGSWVMHGGASLEAFCKLGKTRGYRLIGVNQVHSNAFFMRNDTGMDYFPELSSDSCRNTALDDEVAALAQEKLSAYEWQQV